MNWGYRIIIVLVLFVAAMGSMVYIALLQSNEMVDEKYYEKELDYQNIIDAKKRLMATGTKATIEVKGDSVWILLPASHSKTISEGYIRFLKLSDSKSDRKISMNESGVSAYGIAANELKKGWYRMQLQWTNDGQTYYQEENYYVN